MFQQLAFFVLFLLGGGGGGVAVAAPSFGPACSATNNPMGSTAACDSSYVPVNWGNPTSGSLTVNFQQSNCDSGLYVYLVTNDAPWTSRADDFVIGGDCIDGGSTVEFCCIIEDDGGANPEVDAIGIRGLDTDDTINLVTLAADPLFRDTDMHTSLKVYVYGEGGADSLHGIFLGATSYSTSVCIPTEMRGGPGNDWIRDSDCASTIHGDEGVDWIDAGGGNDLVYGGGGRDRIIGGLGSDTLYGGADADVICGDETNSCYTGCLGWIDTWTLTCDPDATSAFHGNDEIRLDSGESTEPSYAYGQGGGDNLYAGSYTCHLFGGDGTDGLMGDGGDFLDGGLLGDRQCSSNASTTDTHDSGDGADQVWIPTGAYLSASCGAGTDEFYPIAVAPADCEVSTAAPGCPLAP